MGSRQRAKRAGSSGGADRELTEQRAVGEQTESRERGRGADRERREQRTGGRRRQRAERGGGSRQRANRAESGGEEERGVRKERK